MATHTEQLERIAKKIRFLLHNEALTVNNVAGRLGVPKEFLRDIVDAKARPTRHIMQKLCMFFEVKPEFFGEGIQELLWDDPEAGDDEMAGLEAAVQAQKAGVDQPANASSTGGPGKTPESPKKRRRKFDLAELAAHHQALLECLLDKKLIDREEYIAKVDDVRRRANLDT